MSINFKFGRGFCYWTHVNLDFLSMYPTPMAHINPTNEQIEMLMGIRSQYQGRSERVIMSPRAEDHRPNIENQRSHERDTIVLTRRDMSRGREDKPRNLIDWYDFAEVSISRQEFMRASIVIFMDDDGNTRTLKNRYGLTN